ncbi:oxygen-dependent choline dehydrogenase [Folsomia candida]|uniref:Glucose dehydrogenase [FAD, quinone] n=1 Tax=Folsomia candida TaxID=158441 RepID=A0A226D5G3_FOLCA|nr:oxygen-dependent choline dehydrogenase [Folsomia candida]OXA40310.1 Glucose dehydrogenase [FAD, quinone] [Folsomia candida]
MDLTTFAFLGLPTIIQEYAEFYRQRDLAATLKELEPLQGLPKIEEYDFIVVGAGTAGNIVAGRLSNRFSVLLLEMGGDPPPSIYPAYIGSIQSYDMRTNPAINEIYKSIPQSTSALDDNGIATVHAGRMLGGSGSHNSNVYNRGSPLDFDYWAKLLGDQTWDYKNMLKHFKDSENFVGQLVNERQRFEYYGQIGPLRVDVDVPDFLENWSKAAKELGYNFSDPNAHQTPSFTAQSVSLRNGLRESTYDAFVKKKVLWQPTIHKYSQAHKILIDNNNNAYGVAYTRHGIPCIAHAKREVIVSAGAFGSPILLTKSGIGPADVLQAAKIPVKKNMPGVGKNLWDHVMLVLTFRRNDPTYRDPNFEEELKKFQSNPNNRQGYLAHQRRTQAFAVSARAKADGEGDWGDLQVQMIDQPFIESNPGGAVWECSLSRPKSVGEFLFNTTAYLAGETANGKLGLSNFKYFSDPTDMDALIEGINLAIQIMEGTQAFKSGGYKLDESFIPQACRGLPRRSADQWKCTLQRLGGTQWHWSGTCKMGKDSDPMAVVNSKMQVNGINKLRVIDASVMPKVTNSNLNAATMAVAQKGVTEILNKNPFRTNAESREI